MDVFGNLNFQTIFIFDAAKPSRALSPFAAPFAFIEKVLELITLKNWSQKLHIQKTCLTPPIDFQLYATAFLICPVFIYCSLQNKQYAKVTV